MRWIGVWELWARLLTYVSNSAQERWIRVVCNATESQHTRIQAAPGPPAAAPGPPGAPVLEREIGAPGPLIPPRRTGESSELPRPGRCLRARGGHCLRTRGK